MDDSVIRGMAKWPNVPAAYEWLSLDRRGNWLLKGDLISNPTLIAFIGRNYTHDERGCWFFQNGPQRVFVALDYTPLVFRLPPDEARPMCDHRGKSVQAVYHAWLDEDGNLVLETSLGPGLVDDRDLAAASDRLVDALGQPCDEEALLRFLAGGTAEDQIAFRVGDTRIPVKGASKAEIPRMLGFVRVPAPPPT